MSTTKEYAWLDDELRAVESVIGNYNWPSVDEALCVRVAFVGEEVAA